MRTTTERSTLTALPPRMVAALILGVALVAGGSALAAGPSTPGPNEKCPVCGMFVARYPDWLAQVDFKDGTRAFFDGPKDLFRYLLELPKYGRGKKSSDVAAVYVKDYYTLTSIDARQALFVSGSDVYGPMGTEFVPFAKATQARQFLADHKGKKILSFQDITLEVARAGE